MMLERLAGDADPAPLFVLDQALEPLNCDFRRQARHYTFLTPLNRLVDATPPESDPAREFGALAAKWETNLPGLRSRLALWRDNRTRVVPLLSSSALLQEAVPLADEVSAVANAGLEALDYLESKRPPAPDWIDRQRALLKDAAKPRAELLIAIVPGVTKLVGAAAAVP
jgi:hexosaminidase